VKRTPLRPGTTRLRRRMPLIYRGRRQPAKNPWPMTATPEFYAQILEDRGYDCERCRRLGRRYVLSLSLSLSRILPAGTGGGRGGPYTWWNVYLLCGDGTSGCHGWVESHPAEAERERWRVRGHFAAGEYVGPSDWYRERYEQVRNQ
jgi:hypothetical protein